MGIDGVQKNSGSTRNFFTSVVICIICFFFFGCFLPGLLEVLGLSKFPCRRGLFGLLLEFLYQSMGSVCYYLFGSSGCVGVLFCSQI